MVEVVNLENARYYPSEGEPSVRPPYFDTRYVLPEHRDKMLQGKYSHENDSRITFFEKDHVYTVDGIPVEISVSSVLPDSDFNPLMAINMMKKSKGEAWPRKEYVVNARCVSTGQNVLPILGALLYCENTEKTVASVHPSSGLTNIVTKLNSDATKRNSSGSLDLYSFERVMTDEEIVKYWADNAEDARNRGTEAHLQMELWFNSEPCRLDDPEVIVGLKFVRDCLLPIGAKPYRTEWEIFAPKEDVAGSIDLAVILPDGSIVLVDWKRSKKLPKKMRGYSRLPAPLNYLPDCAGVRYATQLSLYHKILEDNYGLKVVGRVLASIHPEVPFFTSVPYLKDEVEYLMAKRRARNEAKEKVKHDDSYKHLICSKSGLLCTEAVRDDKGKLFHKKQAQIDKLIHVVEAKDIEKECELAIKHYEENVKLQGGTSWESVMPVKGVEDVLAFKDS